MLKKAMKREAEQVQKMTDNSLSRKWLIVPIACVASLMFVGGAVGLVQAQARTTLSASSFDGFVVPSKQVILNAPLDAILKDVLVEENEPIKEGQLVAHMDDRLQLVVVEAAKIRSEAEAEISRMEYARDEAEILWGRAKETFEKEAASDWEVRRAKLQLDQANAAVEAGLEQREMSLVELKLRKEELEQYKILAPFDGRVIRIEAETGATLTRNDPVIALAALDPLEAEIHLAAEAYGRLQVGTNYALEAGEPVNREISAKLKTIDPIIDSASQTFRCVFVIENSNTELPAGFAVRLVTLDPMEP